MIQKFHDMNKWLQFGLSAVVAAVLLFAMVFEVSIPLPVFEGPAQAPLVVGIESQAVRERIAIDSSSDSYVYNGADIIGYSDDHTTKSFVISEFVALAEGDVVVVTAAGTITPLGSFQPITSATAITNSVIADGALTGQLLILTNENASDAIAILESGSNLAAGGDITLDGGTDDAVMLLWTGDEWIKVSAFGDN